MWKGRLGDQRIEQQNAPIKTREGLRNLAAIRGFRD
jgi:hypothetical protein